MVQVAYALSNFPLELLPQGEFHLGGCGLPGSQGLTDEQCDTPHRQHLLHPNQTASLNPWCRGRRRMVQRFEPGGEGGEGEGELDTMGFFIAKFRKTAHYADDFA